MTLEIQKMCKYDILLFKCLELVRWWMLNVFEISILCSPRLHLFKWKCSKGSNILKCYYNSKYLFSIWIFKTLSYSCDAKLNFQHDYLFSVTWSFRNHSNMLLWCWINIFFLLLMLKTIVILLCTSQYIFFSLINRKFKRTAFFLIIFFCNIKNDCHF